LLGDEPEWLTLECAIALLRQLRPVLPGGLGGARRRWFHPHPASLRDDPQLDDRWSRAVGDHGRVQVISASRSEWIAPFTCCGRGSSTNWSGRL
jgi:hypothetical protein